MSTHTQSAKNKTESLIPAAQKILLILLSFLLLLYPSDMSFGGEQPPFGDNYSGNPSKIKLYIPLNDYFAHTTNTATLYGWTIEGDIEIANFNRTYLKDGVVYEGDDGGGGASHAAYNKNGIVRAEAFTIPSVRSFDVVLEYDTPKEADFYVVLDHTCSSTTVAAMTYSIGSFNGSVVDNDTLIIKRHPTATEQGTHVKLDNGTAAFSIKVYRSSNSGSETGSVIHNFTFRTADPPDDPDLPGETTVSSIAITTPPTKLSYSEGDAFDPYGMVVTAELSDSETQEISGYHVSVEPEILTWDVTEVTVSYGGKSTKLDVTVKPSEAITDVKIKNGQMFSEWEAVVGENSYYFDIKKNRYDMVALHGQDKGHISFRASGGAQVYVGDELQQADGDGLYHIEIPARNAGDAKTDLDKGAVTVVSVGARDSWTDHTFNCFAQRYDGMPSEVAEYLCIASQYTNGASLNRSYGLNPVSTLRGMVLNNTTGTMYWGPTCLGNLGGYIVYRYDDPITDDPNNPYGVDFIVYGNVFEPSQKAAEPGSVLVSEDGEKWYVLAGSAHYDDGTLWNAWVTYKNQDGLADMTTSYGKEGVMYKYPEPKFYTLYPWADGEEQGMTLTGLVALTGSGPTFQGVPSAAFPDFGYADTGMPGTSNVPLNPYIGLNPSNGWRQTNEGFDLKWAVDSETGLPADLSEKQIHYVKIQSACNIDGGSTAEKSTEVSGVRKAAPADSPVGKTGLPSQILVDGEPINLNEGTGAYGSVYGTKVNPSAFAVNVAAPPGANIYINGARGANRTFGAMPEHRILRVIVQEGQKEPAIVYINLEVDENKQPVTPITVTFDPAGGDVSAGEKYFIPGASEQDLSFPIPVKSVYIYPSDPGEYDEPEEIIHYTFDGWFDEKGNQHESFDPAKIKEDIALTARWKDPEIEATTVTFDANGGTFASGKKTAEMEYELGMTFPVLTRAGYTFDGWYYKNTKHTDYSADLDGEEGLTFTAQWTLKTTTVAFDAKGGLFTSTGKETISRAYSVESTDKNFPTPVREGYKFIGWFDSKGAEYKAYSVAALEDVAELALTAKWEADNSGNNNSETVTAPPTTIKAEHAVTLVVTPEPKTTATGEIVQTVTITDKMLTDAIEKAVAEAEAATAAGGDAPKPQILLPTSVEMTTVTPEAIKFLADNSTSDVEILIPVPGGGAVLDKALAKALEKALEVEGLEDVAGLEVAPEIVSVNPDDAALNEDQKEAAKSADVVAVYDVVYKAGDMVLAVEAQDGESVMRFTLDYKLGTDGDDNREDARGIRVVHIPAEGGRETRNSGYYTDVEQAWFETEHLSLYAVTYDPTLVQAKGDTEIEDEVEQNDLADSPGGGCGTGAVGFAALTALATGAALRRKPWEDGR